MGVNAKQKNLPASATVKTIAVAPGYMNSATAQAKLHRALKPCV
jgi:hypothetical protein